jgi:hypothetical protein
MKPPHSYLVNGGLASAVLYWVFDLSRSGRTLVDWIVLGIVTSAVLYNLAQLGRRVYGMGRGRGVWHLTRTLTFWVVGLLNTVLAPPEEVGSRKYLLGWAFVAIAIVDSVALYRKEQAAPRSPADSGR